MGELGDNRALQDDSLRSLAHELRTPLSVIRLWGRVLRAGNLSAADQERAIDAILVSVDNLGDLIDGLIGHARDAAATDER